MPRTRHRWRIRDGELSLAARTLLAGAIDLSEKADPEKPDPQQRLDQAQALEDCGAGLVELTALPLEPERKIVDSDSELRRLVPVLRKLRPRLTVPLAVATYNSETAARALELGAAIIRDPSGLSFDPKLIEAVVANRAGLVVGHGPGGPLSWVGGRPIAGLAEAVAGDLDSSLARARRAGLDRHAIVIDPGLGTGKQGLQNYDLLDRLMGFSKLGQPVMIGLGERRFLTDSVRASARERLVSEAAFAALAVRGGAHIVRTPNIEGIAAAVELADRLQQARESHD